MSVFRVEKNKNYTVMAKYHLKEKEMSLKAKGLLSLMLSLPDNWDYTIEGLVTICKENKSAIKTTLSELKDFGYLEIIKKMPNNTDTGRIEYEYVIYEKPKQEHKKQGIENQALEFQPLEIQPLENQLQLNNNILNTNKLNNNNIKHKYGEYKNVLLKDDELEKLKKEYPNYEELIKYLDEYIEMKGYKAKSHYLCIKKWVTDAVKNVNKITKVNKKTSNFEQREYGDLSYLYANKGE